MSFFDDTLNKFTDTERQKIRKNLSLWEVRSQGQWIVPNIEKESDLLPGQFIELLSLFLCDMDKYHASDWVEFGGVYLAKCKEIAFEGPLIKLDKTTKLGRMMDFDKFLIKLRNLGYGEPQWNAFIKNLNRNSRLNLESNFKITTRPVYATWSDSDEFPFSFVNTKKLACKNNCSTENTCDKYKTPNACFLVCANLGLIEEQSLRKNILITYSSKNIEFLRKPTIADGGLYSQFIKSTRKGGITRSYPPNNISSKYPCLCPVWIESNIHPRNECVHSAIRVKDVKKLEVINPR